MKLTLFSLNSVEAGRQSGFSLVELLIASSLGLVVTALCLSTLLSMKNVLGRDTLRTRLNQNLRGALEIVTADGRVAGENLLHIFPAVEGTDNGSSDVLVLRRNLLDEVLTLCVTINQGSAVNRIYFATAGNTAGCTFSGNTTNYNSWAKYRQSNGNEVDAFIYDSVSRQGEFFRYNGEASTGSEYYLMRRPGTWQRTYNASASTIYILEEWEYCLEDRTLKLIQNRETEDFLSVAFDIQRFEISFRMQDGTSRSYFARTDDWTRLSSVEVGLTGDGTFSGKTFTQSISGRFFPRNVLSH